MSTTTAHLRDPALTPPHVIPVDRRGTLTAPCDLCAHVRTVQFDDGLCAPCRGIKREAVKADWAQDRQRRSRR